MARGKKERLSISWDSRAINVRVLLERLSEIEGGPYSGRALAEIGGMVLGKYLQQEVNLHGGQDTKGKE